MPPTFVKEQSAGGGSSFGGKDQNKNPPPSGGFLSEYLGELCRQNVSACGGHHHCHHHCACFHVHRANVSKSFYMSNLYVDSLSSATLAVISLLLHHGEIVGILKDCGNYFTPFRKPMIASITSSASRSLVSTMKCACFS